MRQIPRKMFIAGVIGGVSFAFFIFLGQFFGQFWAPVGAAIFGGCIGFLIVSERSAKEEYRKLLEQVKGKPETFEKL